MHYVTNLIDSLPLGDRAVEDTTRFILSPLRLLLLDFADLELFWVLLMVSGSIRVLPKWWDP